VANSETLPITQRWRWGIGIFFYRYRYCIFQSNRYRYSKKYWYLPIPIPIQILNKNTDIYRYRYCIFNPTDTNTDTPKNTDIYRYRYLTKKNRYLPIPIPILYFSIQPILQKIQIFTDTDPPSLTKSNSWWNMYPPWMKIRVWEKNSKSWKQNIRNN